MTLDDRGRLVALAPLDLRREMMPTQDLAPSTPPRPEETARAVRLALVAAPILLVSAAVPVLLFALGSIPRWLLISLVVPLGLVEALVAVHIARRAHAAKIAHRLTAAGRCGSCAHDLAGLRAEADGCRVCPECGAAWK
ncbi:MAG: efflux RND transporter permease subunit [Phycisphaerae bacterium]|nr:efflux RND transporter permease subunit [Phycisphaerae bacterium]